MALFISAPVAAWGFEDHDGEGVAIKPEKRAADSDHGRLYLCVCGAA